jgi:zinc protease
MLAILALLVALITVCAGNLGPSKARENSQTSPLVVPIVKRDSLLNGLQLITLERPGTGSVSAHLRINSGSLFDLAGKGGLADITAGMLLKGAVGLTAKNMSDTVEQLGLTVTVKSSWDSTDIVISGPADALEGIFDLLGKMVIAPAFDQKELDALKASQGALAATINDDSFLVRRKALEILYGSYPFGRPASGTPETIRQITRQDVLYFHNRFYIANNADLIINGDATAEQVTRLGRAKLGAWKKGEKVPPTFKGAEVPAARRILILDRSDERPAQAVFAQTGISRLADDYLPMVVMVDVLSRQLSTLIAAHSGSRIETDLEPRLLAGPLILSVTALPADISGYCDVISDTMTRMAASPPPSDSIEAAKSRLVASMTERLKTTDGTAETILDIETYRLGKDYLITFADRVNAINPVDVQRAAQAHLKPQSSVIVIAGPASRLETQLKKLGTVTVQE